ncbi:hypothetical protein M422DRAFT_274355 [Sphaerobolus stellatus SS14]|uniref:Uncharacterized protein n=1 Tax=Sphaerobolus stellatus (strain SS14) TaxID=990650 RepID=A0A0C9T750_SPHS4|nr:hypothetical protein M422DRAFT_274355 [Sphaerobolus stellatus SS14]
MDPTCTQNPPLPEKEQTYRRLVALSSRSNPRPPTRSYAANLIETGYISSTTPHAPPRFPSIQPFLAYDTPPIPPYESPSYPAIPLYHYDAIQHYDPHQHVYDPHFIQHEYPAYTIQHDPLADHYLDNPEPMAGNANGDDA